MSKNKGKPFAYADSHRARIKRRKEARTNVDAIPTGKRRRRVIYNANTTGAGISL